MAGALTLACLSVLPTRAAEPEQQGTAFAVHPIGHVKKTDDHTLIILDKKYQSGLLGIGLYLPGVEQKQDGSVGQGFGGRGGG